MNISKKIDLFFEKYKIGYIRIHDHRIQYIIYYDPKKPPISYWISVNKEEHDGSIKIKHFYPNLGDENTKTVFFNTALCIILRHAMNRMKVRCGARIQISTSKTGFHHLQQLSDFGFKIHHGPIHDFLVKIGLDLIMEGVIPDGFAFFPEQNLTRISDPLQWRSEFPYGS